MYSRVIPVFLLPGNTRAKAAVYCGLAFSFSITRGKELCSSFVLFTTESSWSSNDPALKSQNNLRWNPALITVGELRGRSENWKETLLVLPSVKAIAGL